MTNKEFDAQFDIFYNNIASNIAPSVNVYEKSVFLTQAQKDIILGLYNGREVPGLSFESTEESRRYLSNLVKTYEVTEGLENPITLPNKLWFIVREEATFNDNSKECLKGTTMDVVPVTQDKLNKVIDNPFKGPSYNRLLRVDLEGKIKLISKYAINKYTLVYLEQPNPIILEDLSEYDTSIDGISTESETNVNPVLHRAILDKAVQLAKIAFIGN